MSWMTKRKATSRRSKNKDRITGPLALGAGGLFYTGTRLDAGAAGNLVPVSEKAERRKKEERRKRGGGYTMIDLIVGGVVVIGAGVAVWKTWKDKKEGKSVCGGCCSSCQSACHAKPGPENGPE